MDISTIFGKGLDHAIEASEKLPEGQSAILLKAGTVQKFFAVLMENNCAQEKETAAEKDDFFHGFGMPNMDKAVQKYGGQMTGCVKSAGLR